MLNVRCPVPESEVKNTHQEFKDHQVIHQMMTEAIERIEQFRQNLKKGHTVTDEVVEDYLTHLRAMRKKEEEHIESTYTVLSGSRESVYAKHGDKLIGAAVTIVVALIGAVASAMHDGSAAAEPPATIIEVMVPPAPPDVDPPVTAHD